MTLSQKKPLPIYLLVIILLVISACQPDSTISENNQNNLMPESPISTETAITVTRPATTTTESQVNDTFTLTVWTVKEISPEAEGKVGMFISNSLRAFRLKNPYTNVDIVLKKPGGKGGMLDFLRTAKNVAPSILPDVVIINATDLNQAYSNGLIQTVDGLLDRPIVQDLLPAARRMGTINDKLIGVPLSMDLEHTVYSTPVFTTTPILWTDVLSRNSKYLFPAKGVNGLVNDAVLAQYFSAGGKLRDDQNKPIIDEHVLLNVLELYKQSLEYGVFDKTILEAATTEELEAVYLDSKADIVQVTAHQYLTKRELFNDPLSFAPIPVKDKTTVPILITHGWAMALATDDVMRQPSALHFIEWFMSTKNNAAWNSINKSIPTRDTSFQQLAGDDPYWIFLTEQLNTARPQPVFEGYDQIGRIIQQAVVQVINGEATPEEAVSIAVDALAP